MINRKKYFSVVFCVIVVIVCFVGYSVSLSQIYYDVCSPKDCALISGYETKELWTVPAEEAYEYGIHYAEGDLKAVEITYELYNPLNEKMSISGNLCHYKEKDNDWISAFDSVDSTADISEYDNRKILPPGESMIFKECVLVSEETEEIYAYPYWGSADPMTISL
ncbi:MAG: hypothetical protein K2P64_05845 [Lachnospiraceae bacterium]|nr:hypothetical protein [Lachnospiraceae bacterium]